MANEDKTTRQEYGGASAGGPVSTPPPVAPFERKPDKESSGARKLPSPAPHEGSTIKYFSDEEVSSATISIKRSSLKREGEKTQGPAPEAPRKETPVPEAPSKRQVKIFCYNCSQKLDLTDLEPFGRIECPSCSVELIVPKWFDNYLLEEPGGVGGMATVYRALDLTLDREVAIKVLNHDVALKIEKKRLFLHEARTAATLNHYAVLPIYTCGEFEDQPYIVMQYMEGGSLDKKIEQMGEKKLPILDVVKWIADVAEGLDNARRHGIIHHDIKPANLMLDRDGNIKIGDFGIAQALRSSESSDIYEVTRLWSSPHFVSPEKVKSGREDHRGDIYSLGATFYNIVTGHTPFELEDVGQLISFKLNNDPPDPRRHRTDIPEFLANLIMAMMARTPELRPGYRDIITQLTSYLRKSEIIDHKKKQAQKKEEKEISPLPKKQAPAAVSAPPGPAPSSAQITERKKSNEAVVILGIVAAIFVIALIFIFSTRSGGGGGGVTAPPQQPASTAVRSYSDLHPEITKELALGNCPKAVSMAEKELANGAKSLDSRLQAAVQLAFATYLRNDRNAKNICNIAAEQLTAAGASDHNPLLDTVKFLGSSNISAETLKSQASGSEEDRLLAATAVFFRSLYDKTGEIDILKTSREFAACTQKTDSKFWGNCFRERAKTWQEWVNYGAGTAQGLEPLIRDNKYNPKMQTKPPEKSSSSGPATTSPEKEPVRVATVKAPEDPWAKSLDSMRLNSLELSDLTPEWLSKNRAFASQRPRPADFEFSDDMISSYLNSLDKEKAAAESARVRIVRSIKPNLCACMMRFSYDGKDITLKGGQTINGSVKANNKYLSIRLKNGSHQRIQWSEIDFRQMVKFLEYFANIRMNAFGGEFDNESQRSYDAAMEMLRIGMLADWYGQYPEAVEYVRKAVALDSRVGAEAKKYIMY